MEQNNTRTEGTVLETLTDIVTTVGNAIRQKSEKILEDLNERRVYTYSEAMTYLLQHKKDSPHIVKGALVRETVPSGYMITCVFLDVYNNLVEDEKGVPLGCKRKAKELDSELSQVFKNYNVVIVE